MDIVEHQVRQFETDVSAVVLTLGEPSTSLALASLDHQTHRLAEVITVQDMRPWHEAMNEGVRRVRTPFLVQVDSDMILDPDCVARLRKAARKNTGIVVGMLRDPLIGTVVGIKLFRTQCFGQVRMPDSISPDTDYGARVRAAGWKIAHVGRHFYKRPKNWDTLGEHSPSYTPEYTYRKHLLEGCRFLYRRSIEGIRWHFSRLEMSPHPMAYIAQAGLANGMFLKARRDLLGIADAEWYPRCEELLRFFGSSPVSIEIGIRTLEGPRSPRLAFAYYYRLGQKLFRENDPASLCSMLKALGLTRGDDLAWTRKIALLRGLASKSADESSLDAEFDQLERFRAMKEPGVSLYTRLGRKIERTLNRFERARS
jgi:glycosyl transferase family 2